MPGSGSEGLHILVGLATVQKDQATLNVPLATPDDIIECMPLNESSTDTYDRRQTIESTGAIAGLPLPESTGGSTSCHCRRLEAVVGRKIDTRQLPAVGMRNQRRG